MSTFHGPQPGEKTDRGPNRKRGPKGAMRMHRALLHEEAVARAKKKGEKDVVHVQPETIQADIPEARKPRKRRRRKVSDDQGATVADKPQ